MLWKKNLAPDVTTLECSSPDMLLKGSFTRGILNTTISFCEELFPSLVDVSARASSVVHEITL